MPRAIWSGSIRFGLVNVPVKVYSAVQQQDLHFSQFEDKTNVDLMAALEASLAAAKEGSGQGRPSGSRAKSKSKSKSKPATEKRGSRTRQSA